MIRFLNVACFIIKRQNAKTNNFSNIYLDLTNLIDIFN